MNREYSGICLQPLFCCRGTPQGLFFWPKRAFPKILDMAVFQKSQFWSKTRFLGHLFGEMSHKSCSYGPYGPFRFSVKSEFWYIILNQIIVFLGKPTFPDVCKKIILLGWILKPPLYVRSHPAGAFCFRKINIPGILGHARFASSCVFCSF